MKRPYGLITGHDEARYEQDGLLFDWQGHALVQDEKEPDEEKEITTNTTEKDASSDEITTKTDPNPSAREFLLRSLKENALGKAVIFGMSEKENINWSEIKEAFIDLNIQEYTFKKLVYWKLPENLMPNNA